MSQTERNRVLEGHAAAVGGASRVCILGVLAILAGWATGCRTISAVEVHDFPSPSSEERYCAWYGEARDGVLYFGEAPFWSASRGQGGAHGDDPQGDLAVAGPQRIGRFDLAVEERLPHLDVGEEGARSGVWDVLPHPNGRVYYTTFYEAAGSVDPDTGEVERYPELGTGLNELALGPEGAIVATRYGGHGGDPDGPGALVLFSEDGLLLAEYPLRAPAGYTLAPKTPAWDEASERYWLSTDLLRRDPSLPPPPSEHPAIVLDARGREQARIGGVELHFARFAADGWGVAAFVADGQLRWTKLGPGEPRWQLTPASGRVIDPDFPAMLDFVQDVSFGADGEALIVRWSGRVHVVGPDEDDHRELALPTEVPGGLYYSGSLSGDRVCATYCADVAVVCSALP